MRGRRFPDQVEAPATARGPRLACSYGLEVGVFGALLGRGNGKSFNGFPANREHIRDQRPYMPSDKRSSAWRLQRCPRVVADVEDADGVALETVKDAVRVPWDRDDEEARYLRGCRPPS